MVVSATFLLVCFSSLNESICQTRKMFLILHQNICSLSRNPKFRILDIQILWRHQMPRHKTGNTFYWIMWKVSSLLMKYGQFISYYKRRYLIKNYTKTASWKLVLGPFVFPAHPLENEFLKQATYIRHAIAKLSKFVQISMQASLDSFLQKDSLKIKKGLELVSRSHVS